MTKKSSLTSISVPATKDQIRRVRTLTMEAVEAILETSGFNNPELQTVHANSGVYKEELMAHFQDFVRAFSRKARGIFIPIAATQTGLVPAGLTVESDNLETEIAVTRLDFNSCPVKEGEDWIDGDTMLARATEVSAIGSLGFAKIVLDAQAEGKDIIPVEVRSKYILLPRTVLRDRDRNRSVGCLYWDGERWELRFGWLGRSRVFRRGDRFVRPRE